jgi:hypothetical protein
MIILSTEYNLGSSSIPLHSAMNAAHSYKVYVNLAGHWWLTSVILATWKAEMRKSEIRASPSPK